MIAVFNPPKDENPLAGGFPSGATKRHIDDDSANRAREKALSNTRAKLCLAGGQRLHVAEDGAFFVSTPFGQITRFENLAALQAHADRGAR